MKNNLTFVASSTSLRNLGTSEVLHKQKKTVDILVVTRQAVMLSPQCPLPPVYPWGLRFYDILYLVFSSKIFRYFIFLRFLSHPG